MLSQASFASSSRSIPHQVHRKGPNPQILNRRIAFSMESIKISQHQATVELNKTPSIDNPVQTMFNRYQQRLKDQGRQRLSYPREYKLAAIEQVKSGRTRYKVAKDLNITKSMLGKWVIKYSDILAQKKGGRREVLGRQAKFPLLESAL